MVPSDKKGHPRSDLTALTGFSSQEAWSKKCSERGAFAAKKSLGALTVRPTILGFALTKILSLHVKPKSFKSWFGLFVNGNFLIFQAVKVTNRRWRFFGQFTTLQELQSNYSEVHVKLHTCLALFTT